MELIPCMERNQSFSTFSDSWCKKQGAKIVKSHHEIFKQRYNHLLLNCYYFHSYWPFMKNIHLPLQFVYFWNCFCLFDLHSDSSGTPADPLWHTSVLWHMSWKSLNYTKGDVWEYFTHELVWLQIYKKKVIKMERWMLLFSFMLIMNSSIKCYTATWCETRKTIIFLECIMNM
jgi:hypothetical protein